MVTTYEHPLDVLTALLDWSTGARCALVVLVGTEGGSVRAPGALMAVREDGQVAGYVSGGCIDADLVYQAKAAILAGQSRQIRYGAGSPFVDLPLPCGGALDLLILPEPAQDTIKSIVEDLAARCPVSVSFSSAGVARGAGERDSLTVPYEPKMRLRVAGRGADCMALARLAQASGIETVLQLTDEDDVCTAQSLGFAVEALVSPHTLPVLSDDPWTAFVLMFHDGDWETPLLQQALSGSAFYIGAVGSRRTHAKRLERLCEVGVASDQAKRIHGPVGLVPSLRDASFLAVSALAEIIGAFSTRLQTAAEKTAVILLAAGASSRFEGADKLSQAFKGKPLLSHAASLRSALPFGICISVVGPDQDMRARTLETYGWRVVTNAEPQRGQASSLNTALAAIEGDSSIEQVLILLADMPEVRPDHLRELLLAAQSASAVMVRAGTNCMPPALFHRSHFDSLKRLTGDVGAKTVFMAAADKAIVEVSPMTGLDIDTRKDLSRLEALTHG